MSTAKIEEWLAQHNIDEIECLVPDPAGTPRGKILPTRKFLKGIGNTSMRLPEDIFILTVTGKYSWQDSPVSDASGDVYLVPDFSTLKLVPWHANPTAQVICDTFYLNGDPVDIAPRHVLKHVLQLYAKQGWKPIVAPELEFYLVKKNLDADYPLEAPVGTSGRAEKVGQAYGIDAANEYDPIVEDIYDFCEAQEIDIDTISHESGPAQLEINFNHGDPLELADQVFLFKRTVRQAALKHDVYATFMAKPHQDEPGSSMHLHQSLLDLKTGDQSLQGTRQETIAIVPRPCCGTAALHACRDGVLCAQCEFIPPPGAELGCTHQHSLGHRQSNRTIAHAEFRPAKHAHRKPCSRR